MDKTLQNHRFTHLHVHSSYSLGVGLSPPHEICAHAARAGYGAVALTDTNGTYGFLELHAAARRNALKPIYGAIIFHAPAAGDGGGRFAATVLATTRAGLRNVAALAALSETAGEHQRGVSIEALQAYADDIVVLCGSARSEVVTHLLTGDRSGAEQSVNALKTLYGDRLFIEIQDPGNKKEKDLADALLDIASRCGCAPVLTREVRYVGTGMRDLYGFMSGVRRPTDAGDFFEIDERFPDRHMKSALEMEKLRQVYPEAYDNTAVIEDMVEGDLLAGIEATAELPLVDASVTDKQSFLGLCLRNFYHKYKNLANHEITSYQRRIQREVDEIERAGLVPTFLFAHEVLARVRKGGIGLGPATGLNLQSFCAHLLDVTTYDPYRTTPNFQPMLDPRSNTVEEIELQITSEGRAETLRRLQELLGPAALAYAPGIERITPIRAVKMIAKVADADDEVLHNILNIIGRHPGRSLRDMMGEDRQLGRVCRQSPDVADLLARAALLEDLPIGFAKSRRSLAVATAPLADFFGVTTDERSGDVFVQAPREVLPVGQIFRIDFTPLGAVSILTRAHSTLTKKREAYPGWNKLVFDDAPLWKEIREGDTMGVFLLEGDTMRENRSAFPLGSLVDLTNYLALMRLRGERRTIADRLGDFQKKEDLSADREDLRAILADTNGHILYDEQLRDIVCALTARDGTASLRMLNDLRAGTPGALARARREFMTATADHDVPMEVADRWFERVLHNVPRTIRRERVLADALLVVQSFYLRLRYEDIFYVSVLNTYWRNEAKLRKYLAYLRERDRIVELDINKSRVRFTIEDGKIRVGLCGVWGLSRETIVAIAKQRRQKKFASLEDFIERMRSELEREELRHLVMAGAFDFEGTPRKDLAKAATRLLGKPGKTDKAKKSGQMELPF